MDSTSPREERSALFNTQLQGHILWDYSSEGNRIHSLFELAKAKVWKVSQMPWEEIVDQRLPPEREQFEPLRGFAGFDALPKADQIRLSWQRHGMEVSDILHGEQGALLIASQLVSCLSDMDAKLFASSQVTDEARHVEFFSRYLLEVVGTIHPPSDPVARLIRAMANEERWDYKFIACQILIESLALARLQEIRRTTLVPVLAYAIDYICADEARHVRFGVEVLRRHLATLSASEVQQRSDFVVDHVLQLADAMNVYTRLASVHGWDERALRYHLRRHRSHHPQPGRDRFRQLMLNMKSVGLLTGETQKRLAKLAGLP